MNCEGCESGLEGHVRCSNPTTCICQHRLTELMPDGTLVPLSERDYLLDPKNVAKELKKRGKVRSS